MAAGLTGEPDARSIAALLRTARPAAGPQTRSASIAHAVEELILRGDLPRGEHLPTEAELGEVLGVSRSVVRDAVRMLVARGLPRFARATAPWSPRPPTRRSATRWSAC